MRIATALGAGLLLTWCSPLLLAFHGSAPVATHDEAESPDAVLAQVRHQIDALLSKPEPELYARHLRSVLALSEEEVLELSFANNQRDAHAKELLNYLNAIDRGLSKDGNRPELYMVNGQRALTIARASRSDGTLQFYTVRLPQHWDPNKAYPLWLWLHGRESDLGLSYVADSFLPHEERDQETEEVVNVVPWLRGSGELRMNNGSEPDVWEAIDDIKSFVKLDPDRWYISGHSWGGDDVWSIVLRTPDLWAAAGIMAGNPASLPSHSGLVSNARYVPFYLWVGDRDPIKNRMTSFEYFRDALNSVGNFPKLVVASGVGHVYRPQDAAALEAWLLQHARHRPNSFNFLIDTAEHRGVWGVSVPRRYPDAYLEAEPHARFECRIYGPTVRIQTWGAKKLEVNLGPEGLNVHGTAMLIVDGKVRFSGRAPEKALSLNVKRKSY